MGRSLARVGPSAGTPIAFVMDLTWEDRQRAFQAKVLTEGERGFAIGVRRTGPSLAPHPGTPPPAGSRLGGPHRRHCRRGNRRRPRPARRAPHHRGRHRRAHRRCGDVRRSRRTRPSDPSRPRRAAAGDLCRSRRRVFRCRSVYRHQRRRADPARRGGLRQCHRLTSTWRDPRRVHRRLPVWARTPPRGNRKAARLRPDQPLRLSGHCGAHRRIFGYRSRGGTLLVVENRGVDQFTDEQGVGTRW